MSATTLLWKMPTTRKARLWTVAIEGDPFVTLTADDAEATVNLGNGSGAVIVRRGAKMISSVFDTSGNLPAIIRAAIGGAKE